MASRTVSSGYPVPPGVRMGAGAAASVPLLSGCASATPSTAMPDPGVGTALDRPVPGSVASLPLRDPSGQVTTLASLRGKTVVISDSMTLCSEDCPLDTANIVASARTADATGLTSKVVFLTITVDPKRDDARHLTAYRKLYDTSDRLPNWELLTGSQGQIRRLWKYFGVYHHRVPQGSPPTCDWFTGRPLTYDVQHADEVLLLDSRGNWRYVLSGHAQVPTSQAVPGRMRAFLSKKGRQHLDHPNATTWTTGDLLASLGWLTGHRLADP